MLENKRLRDKTPDCAFNTKAFLTCYFLIDSFSLSHSCSYYPFTHTHLKGHLLHNWKIVATCIAGIITSALKTT